jgi:hypothetical protein
VRPSRFKSFIVAGEWLCPLGAPRRGGVRCAGCSAAFVSSCTDMMRPIVVLDSNRASGLLFPAGSRLAAWLQTE